MVFVSSLYLLKLGSTKQRVLLTLFLIPAMLAIIGSDRRTAYPVLGASMVFVAVMMPREFQRKALRIGWKLGILFVIYLGIFWNSRSDSIFLMPVQNIREGIAGDDQEAAGERYSSNLYRKAENYDLFNMIKSQPIIGHGYGVLVDYRMPVPVQWELGFYIPHNQVLGVFAKTGVVGFTIFLLFYFSVAARLARGFGELAPDDYHRAILVLVGAGMINHIVYSFFDIMLTYYRNNVYLGTLFGLAGTIMALRKQEHEAAPSVAPAAPREEPQVQLPRLLQPHADNSGVLKLGQ
jgi:O-antigen ligase